jgi:hypothetical protein
MKTLRTITIAAMCLAAFAIAAFAQEGKSQADLASKSSKFDTVASADASVKSAMDAHELKKAAAMVGKTGSFMGTVTKVFTPNSGSVVILNFDKNYKDALTAVVKRSEFGKFPDLNKLDGKHLLITGKFVDFHGATEIDLTDPSQVKIIE